MEKFRVDVRAEIALLVPARRRLAKDERTATLEILSDGGTQRQISMAIGACNAAEANLNATRLLREVLGDLVTGELWVEETSATGNP